MRLKTTFAFVCLLTLQFACQRPWPSGVIARWEGGDVDLAGVEAYLEESLEPTLSGEELSRRYREAAQELCVRHSLLRLHETEYDSRFSTSEKEVSRRQITVQAWVANRVSSEIKVTPEEIEAFYIADPDRFHRPERRFVEHIFRRTNDTTSGAAALEILAEVRARYLEGDSFHTLAVEYSQSETAAVGGILGLVSRGELHTAAEQAVFSLEIGEISRPVPVHGGLAVFVVTEIYAEMGFPLADVRSQIAQQLQQETLRHRLDVVADENPLPGTLLAVSEDAFPEVLESDDPDVLLYSDDDLTFSVGEWRERLRGGTTEAQLAKYTDFLRLQRLYHFVVTSGFLDEPGRRDAIERRFENSFRDQVVRLIAHDLLEEEATANPTELRSWYDGNHKRFQSPIELLVNLVAVKPTEDVEHPTDLLMAIASSYAGGDLEHAATSIPGATSTRNWVGIDTLNASHPRVTASLMRLNPPACGPVFNVGGALHLFCLEDRRDPQQLSFDEAHDRVVSDFIAANEQELYAEIRSEILDETKFEFNEARVREVLHAPLDAKE